ncbi:hypothetical protein DFQ26_006010 [Actinomortierella ambigua]|nr:hypothetical protein DFQ26_006010 [Actinomortierella ambigua]
MISLGFEPLPHVIFPHNWVESLSRRHQIPQALRRRDVLSLLQAKQDVVLQGALQRLRTTLKEYARDDDVYLLDETSKFATPPCRELHPGEHYRLVSTLDGWQSLSFGDWLYAFSNKLDQDNRDVLLLVPSNVWQRIQGNLPPLPRVRIEPVPAQLNAWLPTRTGIVREFKLHVEAINFQETFTGGPFSHDGDVYRTAWQQVDVKLVQACFEQFKNAIKKSSSLPEFVAQDGSTPAWNRLYGVYKEAQGRDLLSDKTVKFVESVLGSYKNLDIDIGPSAYLCEELKTSPSDPHLQSYFEVVGLCTRPVGQWWDHNYEKGSGAEFKGRDPRDQSGIEISF